MVLDIESRFPATEYEKDKHQELFWEQSEFINLLDRARQHEFNDTCFKKLKEFITKSQPSDFIKNENKNTIMKCLYSFLSELYRKLNVRNTMAQ